MHFLEKANESGSCVIRLSLLKKFGSIFSLSIFFYHYCFQKQSLEGIPEAVAPRCSVKKVLLKISQNSQENTCTRVSFNKVATDIGILAINIIR